MKWQDKGIILSQRPCNEGTIILNVLTETHGRHSGIMRVGKTQQQSASFQPGNFVEVTWNARLSEHLGKWTTEVTLMPWIQLLNQPHPLLALSTACTLIDGCLPERHPYIQLYEKLKNLLDHLTKNDNWPKHYVFFELKLLSTLGFGLDLNSCAVTQTKENLTYVSPKTGRAVCEEIGKPYAERLFLLPHFLVDENVQPTTKELLLALNITGYFLNQFLFENRKLPEIRQRLLTFFSRPDVLKCA
jgi:DNA repair protein RecO (recombination protein O)